MSRNILPPFASSNHCGSVVGIIYSLEEDNEIIRYNALSRLNYLLDDHWPEISNYKDKIHELCEIEDTSYRSQAILLASRLQYFLGNMKDSLKLAMCIPTIFEKCVDYDYVQSLIANIFDKYISEKDNLDSSSCYTTSSVTEIFKDELSTINVNESELNEIDNLMCTLIESTAINSKEKNSIGMAIEIKRLDVLENILINCEDKRSSIKYVMQLIDKFYYPIKFKEQILLLLLRQLKLMTAPDFNALAIILLDLKMNTDFGQMIIELILNPTDNPDNWSIATQICFDANQYCDLEQLLEIMFFLKRCPHYISSQKSNPTPSGNQQNTDNSAVENVDLSGFESAPQDSSRTLATQTETSQFAKNEASSLNTSIVDNASSAGRESNNSTEMFKPAASLDTRKKNISDKLHQLISILRGAATARIHFEFLIRNVHTDVNILRIMRNLVKSSISLLAMTLANGYANCGTTADNFYRENVDWISRCANWAKFTTISSIGLIHRNNEKEGMKLLALHVPRGNVGNEKKKYEEGGSLLALGFIYMHRSSKVKRFLWRHFKSAKIDAVYYGAALGLALTTATTNETEIIEKFKTHMFNSDSLIKAEAAGYSYGLVSAGHYHDEAARDFSQLVMNLEHEKLIRSTSVAVAMSMMKNESEEVKRLISYLLSKKQPKTTLMAAHCIGMAYIGTGHSDMIRVLWDMIITETSDEIRRTAILSIAFVLLRDQAQCYDIMAHLFKNHNPAIRAACALALGVVFASTGSSEAYYLLKLLHTDIDGRTRQASYIATGMIMNCINEENSPVLKSAREAILHGVLTKSSDQLARFGAYIACGIIDAGGKNLSISLISPDNKIKILPVCGMYMFLMSHYWFPFINFLSLAMVPSYVVCIRETMNLPRVEFCTNKPPSFFQIPMFTMQQKPGRKSKHTSKLSTFRRNRKVKRVYHDQNLNLAYSQTNSAAAQSPDKTTLIKSNAQPIQTEELTDDQKSIANEKESLKTPLYFVNPFRVNHIQLSKIKLSPTQTNYRFFRNFSSGSIVIVRDTSATTTTTITTTGQQATSTEIIDVETSNL